ncbi:MAG: cytochrome c-type biogenesis protein CcmH [Trueperaceae bacterium]
MTGRATPLSPPRRATPVLAAVLALVASAFLAFTFAQDVEIESRVFDIARKLRCPVCVSESVADSNAQLAQQMRALIQQELEEGRSEEQIYAYFQARYGDWIMLEPPKRGIHLLVWLLPVLVAVAAVVTVALLARRWLAAARTPVQADQDDVARVRAQLGRPDADASGDAAGPTQDADAAGPTGDA